MSNQRLAARNPPAFIIEPIGGLGNQLFQYALGRRMALVTGANLAVDPWWFDGTGARSFALDSFDSTFDCLQASSRQRGRRRLSLAVRTPRLARLLFRDVFAAPGETFDTAALSQPPGTRFVGYFQSWRYFADVADTLRAEIGSIRHPSGWFTSELDRLRQLRRVIAVHVRRGDYANAKTGSRHGVLDASYYASALNRVDLDAPSTTVVVYSDDPSSAGFIKDLVGGRCPVYSVEHSLKARPIETLVLMASSDAIICANSTFSWWAAYLGERTERTVTVPRQWFVGRSIDVDARFLPTWVIT